MKDSGDKSSRRPRQPAPLAQVGPTRPPVSTNVPPVVTGTVYVADEVAALALATRHATERATVAATISCDVCEAPIEGEPAGRGLYFWSRGEDDLRFEEPGLCETCAAAIVATASRRFEIEEEEG